MGREYVEDKDNTRGPVGLAGMQLNLEPYLQRVCLELYSRDNWQRLSFPGRRSSEKQSIMKWGMLLT